MWTGGWPLCYYLTVIYFRILYELLFYCCCSQEDVTVPVTVSQTVDDEVRRVAVARLSAKLHSCQCIVDADGTAKVCCVFSCSLLLFGMSSSLKMSLKLSFVQRLNIIPA